jgi:hypothetical protein
MLRESPKTPSPVPVRAPTGGMRLWAAASSTVRTTPGSIGILFSVRPIWI